MNNNQKLTGIVFTVVTMAVMFGLHTTFLLVETAEATHSSYSCKYKSHRVYGMSINNQYGLDSGKRDRKKTHCQHCSHADPTWHTRKRLYDQETITRWYEHKYLWQISWSNCHTHVSVTKTYYWSVVPCTTWLI